MKRITAFFNLIRVGNLFFILLTQFLFTYCIIIPIFEEAGITNNLHGKNFWLFSLASILIAGAGNIINDYFDINIDVINKPNKVIIGKYIHRHWAIACHTVLSLIGVFIGFYLDFTSTIHLLGLWNFVSVTLLFVYSAFLKQRPVFGNILIAVLCSWSIIAVTWCESAPMLRYHHVLNIAKISRFSFLYGSFAFVITLIREVVKDLEDMEGDRRLDCKTMPIIWGVTTAKTFASVWLTVIIAMIIVLQFYVLQFHWFLTSIYCIVLMIIPLILCFKKLIQAKTSAQYHEISSWLKWIMLIGILSMILIRLNA